MGHVEQYEFTDARFDAAYSANTQQEIQMLADKVGYTGPIKSAIKAFPPKPSFSVLQERALREQHDADDKIPW